MPSIIQPKYSCYITKNNNNSTATKYDVTEAIIDLTTARSDNSIAKKASITLENATVNGQKLSGIITVTNRVYIYADTGSGEEEVFRGFVWERTFKSANEDQLQLVCYDNLIYLQKSKDSLYFGAGKGTKDIMQEICDKWGIQLDYSFTIMTHPKLPIRNQALTDIFIELLDAVKAESGAKYVIYSSRNVLKVRQAGYNTTLYKFISGQNVINTSSSVSMDDVITRVLIIGKEDEDDRSPVEATIDGNVEDYGTLQSIITRNTNTTLEEAKKEAENTIKEHGKPKNRFGINVPDVPFLDIGFKVYVEAADIQGYFIVTSVEHDAKGHSMSMELEEL